jgi:hypothetical protein
MVHEVDPREDGRFRISLTYDSGSEAGRSGAHTDTYSGHLARLEPGELVEQRRPFSTDPPDRCPRRVNL